MKNTPLGFLTACSYELLNVLHQIAGYATIAYAMAHAMVYIVAVSFVKHLQWATRSLPKPLILTDYHSQWSKSATLHELLYTFQIVGITAGFAMLFIFASALLLRKLQYETFHAIQILMVAPILVTVGMHRSNTT